MDYKKTAQEIYEKVGRKENLVSAAHCATRLRLVLADNARCDAKAVEDIDGVKGGIQRLRPAPDHSGHRHGKQGL